MIKKYIGILFLIGLFTVISAQNTNAYNTTTENDVKNGENMKVIDWSLNKEDENELQNIKGGFCNSFDFSKENQTITKELGLEMRPGKKKEICTVFFNQGDKPVSIVFGFSKGVVDKGGSMSCDSDMKDKNDFSKNIINNPSTGIIIPPKQTIIQKFNYAAPKDGSGYSYGCALYQLNKETSIEPGKMFLILSRKSSYIRILITGDVYNFGRWDDTKDIYTNNKNSIFKVISAIIAVRLILTILKTSKKSKKNIHK